MPGFKPTTFWTRVITHYHQTDQGLPLINRVILFGHFLSPVKNNSIQCLQFRPPRSRHFKNDKKFFPKSATALLWHQSELKIEVNKICALVIPRDKQTKHWAWQQAKRRCTFPESFERQAKTKKRVKICLKRIFLSLSLSLSLLVFLD